MSRVFGAVLRFFSHPAFPLAAMGVVLGWAGFLLGLAAAGPYLPLLIHNPELLRFLDEVRAFCLGYDPATRTYRTDYLLMMVLQPLVLLGIIAAVWGREVRVAFAGTAAFLRRRRGVAAGLALGLVALVAAVRMGLPSPEQPVRLSGPLPPLPRLVDQDGRATGFDAFRGKVLVLTFFYTRCAQTCPLVIQEAKALLEAFPGREDLVVLALTLDPERDTPRVLKAYGTAHGVDFRRWHFLTGPPQEVYRTLERLGVPYVRRPATASIDHANRFLLVDRQGRLTEAVNLAEGARDTLKAWVQELLAG